ncbi:hypothetical protein [Labilithrix luteola]|nr:hypothetical protein [Labilithrix luteola]
MAALACEAWELEATGGKMSFDACMRACEKIRRAALKTFEKTVSVRDHAECIELNLREIAKSALEVS